MLPVIPAAGWVLLLVHVKSIFICTVLYLATVVGSCSGRFFELLKTLLVNIPIGSLLSPFFENEKMYSWPIISYSILQSIIYISKTRSSFIVLYVRVRSTVQAQTGERERCCIPGIMCIECALERVTRSQYVQGGVGMFHQSHTSTWFVCLKIAQKERGQADTDKQAEIYFFSEKEKKLFEKETGKQLYTCVHGIYCSRIYIQPHAYIVFTGTFVTIATTETASNFMACNYAEKKLNRS